MKIINTFFIVSVLLLATNVHAATVTSGGLTVTDDAYLEKEPVVSEITIPYDEEEQIEIVIEDTYIKSPIVLSEETHLVEESKALATSDIYSVIKNFISIFSA